MAELCSHQEKTTVEEYHARMSEAQKQHRLLACPGFDDGSDGLYIEPTKGEARRKFAEPHRIAMKALRCTATTWFFIVTQCPAIP